MEPVPVHTDPAIAGLPAETESYGYDSTGLGYQTSLDGAQGIVLNTGYTPLGDVDDLNLGVSGTNSDQVSFDYTYDGLRRLTNFKTTDSASTGPHLINATYGYNNANRITHVWDTGGAGNWENQCYAYGDFGRLATEWTPSTSSCAASTQAAASIGGAAPYWKSFVYAGNGRRTSRVDHAFGTAADDKTWTYTYGATCSGIDQSSRILTGVKLVTGSTTTANSSYCVNAAGDQTASATLNGTARSATWDSENHLATVATGTTKYDYLYDADGSVLIKRPDGGAAGTTTLYLGDTEVQATKSSSGSWTFKGQRYYTDDAAGTVAVRTGIPGQTSTLTYLAADPQGTTDAEWSATTPGTSRAKRYTDAYGTPITSPAWPDNKRFLGKTWDGTMGLSALGARQYDPQTGRFISADPLLTADDPSSLDEYSYSDDDPVNEEDPSGESGAMVIMCDDRPCSVATGQHTPPASSPSSPATTAYHSAVGQVKHDIASLKHDAAALAADEQKLRDDNAPESVIKRLAMVAGFIGLGGADLVFPEDEFGDTAEVKLGKDLLLGGAATTEIEIDESAAEADVESDLADASQAQQDLAKAQADQEQGWDESHADRGDGRDPYGRFTGAGGYGIAEEAQGLADYSELTGRAVIPTKVRATIPGFGARYYDGLSENPDGTYTGIEVKSGGAGRTPHQNLFDSKVDSGTAATAKLGEGEPIKITATYLQKVN